MASHFYAMLNMAGINAYIIHRSNTQTNQKRRHFIKALGRLLVTEHLKRRKETVQLPRQLRKRIREFIGEPEQEAPIRVPGVRKRCQVCPYARHRKTANVCEDCHKYICPEHTISFCRDCATITDNNDL
ncbi:unnamed protein product [Danaus chrysippus]|uniref:(African queen) hypothetical protein n=1 Tax=Danaus chrysippus TaxID=151541 RepID=A0A8J2W7W1_9NEOP|nr:unnamed protein product [Danaus chrysippus]